MKSFQSVADWSVADWFDWKNHNGNDSVENSHKNALKKLGWRHPDVLYSFLGIYCLGLETQSQYKDRFNQLWEQENNARQKRYSRQFLQKCCADSHLREFNNTHELKDFLSVYYSLGNLIPVWPGGNSARGIAGVYDIPEVFFHQKDVRPWAERLLEVYPDAALSDVVKTNILAAEHGSVYAVFDSITNFKTWLGHEDNYFRYVSHCIQVIQSREKHLKKHLRK